MWLLNVDTGELEAFEGQPPSYAILSHRWQSNEVTFDDVKSGLAQPVKGKDYSKIHGFCQYVRSHSSIKYVWVDTCCIDKRNNVELSEAINSMFRWYDEATQCCVYLADVTGTDKASFQDSEWFTRGWTLQELIAPGYLFFVDSSWTLIGDRHYLSTDIHAATGIPISVLSRPSYSYFEPGDYSVADRMSWAAERRTTRVEDIAYSLLGLFEVNMPLIYGEGERAFYRLQQEILKESDDTSILAWEKDSMPGFNSIARSPSSFKRNTGYKTWEAVRPYHFVLQPSDYSSTLTLQGAMMTSVGITMSLMMKPCSLHTYFVPVCQSIDPGGQLAPHHGYFCVALWRNIHDGRFYRTTFHGRPLILLEKKDLYGLQMRTIVLGRGEVPPSAREIDTESFWTLAITDIARSLLEEGADVIYRIDSEASFREMHVPVRVPLGIPGVAGMIRFPMKDGTKLFFLLGHDFDFNFFCLSLHVPSSMLQTVGPHDILETFSCPSIRKEPFEIASNKDMMELMTMMRKMNMWSFREHDMSTLHLMWNHERSAVFHIDQAFTVRIQYDGYRFYGVTIDAIKHDDILARWVSRDSWNVQPWPGWSSLRRVTSPANSLI